MSQQNNRPCGVLAALSERTRENQKIGETMGLDDDTYLSDLGSLVAAQVSAWCDAGPVQRARDKRERQSWTGWDGRDGLVPNRKPYARMGGS